MKASDKFPIEYSCYVSRSRAGEKFSSSHVISYIVSGSMLLTDEYGQYEIKAGEAFFFSRNALVKYTKTPAQGDVFKSISLFLGQDILRKIALELDIETGERKFRAPFARLKKPSLTADYMRSLIAYENILSSEVNSDLLELKQKEAVLLLLSESSDFRDILFDFSAPGKIDLAGFMKKNFHFKVELSRFAYLTGRSLSTFKRDFERIFHMTPSKWLQHQRLDEAHYLITQKHKRINEVYSEVGFEDFSHFSFAYKKRFGFPPSADKISGKVK